VYGQRVGRWVAGSAARGGVEAVVFVGMATQEGTTSVIDNRRITAVMAEVVQAVCVAVGAFCGHGGVWQWKQMQQHRWETREGAGGRRW